MKDKVLIMMATYNGEKYIKEQIDSILEQTFSNFDLIIRDDGSSDNTLDVIRSYVRRDSRITLYINQKAEHGVCLNFYELLREAKKIGDKYSYFFFSDQDDIWEINKVEIEIEKIKKCKDHYLPILVYSDLMIMDELGNNQCRMSEIQNINLINKVDIFFNQIYVWGNTIAFNRPLLDVLQIPVMINNSISHDHYLTFYAAAYGAINYIDMDLVRYRRYDHNVSDLPHKYSMLSAIKKLLLNPFKIINAHALNYNNILFFIKNAPIKNQLLLDIEECYSFGGLRAINIMKKYHVIGGSNRYNRLAKKLILITKIYRINRNFRGGRLI